MLSVEATGHEPLLARLDAMPAAVQAAVQAKASALAIELQRHVQQDKLSGQVLKARSGALRDSIAAEVQVEGEEIYARVFCSGDVKYAAIHEYGGRTPAHDIVPDKAKALAFMAGGKQVFAEVVHHPGSTMPQRSFLRSSLDDMGAEIAAGLKEAALQAVRS